jgi:hypothetical protein
MSRLGLCRQHVKISRKSNSERHSGIKVKQVVPFTLEGQFHHIVGKLTAPSSGASTTPLSISKMVEEQQV